MQITFMLASITCLKPFLRPFRSGYFASSEPHYGYKSDNSATKPSRHDAYLDLSTARSAGYGKDGTIVLTTMDSDGSGTVKAQHDKASLVTRPDVVDHEAIASFADGQQQASGQPKKMSISRTQTYSISYGDDQPQDRIRR